LVAQSCLHDKKKVFLGHNSITKDWNLEKLVHLEVSTEPYVHQKFEIFWINIASTMACPNCRNGPKNRLRPLGVNSQIGISSSSSFFNYAINFMPRHYSLCFIYVHFTCTKSTLIFKLCGLYIDSKFLYINHRVRNTKLHGSILRFLCALPA
jgi:hypothetical protein